MLNSRNKSINSWCSHGYTLYRMLDPNQVVLSLNRISLPNYKNLVRKNSAFQRECSLPYITMPKIAKPLRRFYKKIFKPKPLLFSFVLNQYTLQNEVKRVNKIHESTGEQQIAITDLIVAWLFSVTNSNFQCTAVNLRNRSSMPGIDRFCAGNYTDFAYLAKSQLSDHGLGSPIDHAKCIDRILSF